MAHVTGTRRVRMVGAEHWTDSPEQELTTLDAGGDTYAVHERLAVDSARLRLVLAPGEDPVAAARELHGEVVRDVRVFRLVVADGTATVAEGLPQWRLTLPALDDPEHDPLPGLVARLAGDVAVASPEPVTEDVAEEPVEAVAVVVEEPAAVATPEPEVAEVLAVAGSVPALEPLPEPPPLVVVPTVADVVAPALEPVIPVETFLPEPAAEVPVLESVEVEAEAEAAELAEQAELAELEAQIAALEAAEAAEAQEAPAVAEPVDESEPEAVVAETVEAPAEAAFDDVFEDPFAVPAEVVWPLEAEDVAADVDAAAEPVADLDVAAPVVAATAVAAAVVAEPDAAAELDVAAEQDVAAEAEVEVEDTPAEPDPLDAAWSAVAAVVAGDRPACSTSDRDGVCAVPADVVWQTAAGAAWACAWHWPSTMSGHVGAEVGAVHLAEGWTTWRDADPVALAREAADLFTAAARGHDKPVARALVALDTLDDMLRRLPDDVRGAILLWAVAVTNPEWDVDSVAQHGRVALEQAQAEGRAVAWPEELYFQEQALRAPISPTGDEPPVVEAAPQIDGDRLFEQGNAAAAAGDARTAKRLWTDAAEGADHALSMRALGDLARDSGDVKTAEEWYGRAAFQNEPTSMTRIGMIYLQKGQSERAAEWLRRAARFGDDEATVVLQGLVAATA